jgi:hypothetical protein
VYVVSNCWWRDGATVIGAATDLDGAEEIADRPDEFGDPVAGWSEWSADGNSWTWRRDALHSDGSPHASLYQEIIRVPLAGMVKVPPTGEVVYETGGIIDAPIEMDRIIGSASAPNVTPQPGIPPWLTVDRLKQVVAELHGKRKVIDEVRVGDGPAWEWLKAGLDRLTTYPSGAPMPDSRAAAMIWGIPVRLDPNVPKDEIRMGDVVFVIGSADPHSRVPDGHVVRIDKGWIERVRDEGFRRDLRNHLRSGQVEGNDPEHHPET